MSEFSEYVVKAARAAGFNLDSPRGGARKALAEATGMSQSSVGRMLAGTTLPDTRVLPKLADVLGVPRSELLYLAGVVTEERAEAERPTDAARVMSANVRRLRQARGWTQVEAAQRFAEIHGEHWSNASWSQAEQSGGSRQRAWSVDELVSMARLFGVPAAALLPDPPACPQCKGAPPVGFTCNSCETGGTR
ncbi:helix-turn-helix transcriptional regulator [Streptomyces bottropensis]|uniref:helix-turn-helix transcriptional regulator n=1 Tax=Streptomyces bottropensis TaxID=42235 RepID=UPI0036804436